MAIQTRRGYAADFDPNKMLPGEPATVIDGEKVYIAFAPGKVKRMSTYEDMTADIEEANSEIVADLTAKANAAGNMVEGVLEGVNHIVDIKGTYYKLGSENGVLYLQEIAPDPTPPPADTILTDISNLKNGKQDKSNMIHTDAVNDSTKYPSSEVTYAHGQELAILASIFGGRDYDTTVFTQYPSDWLGSKMFSIKKVTVGDATYAPTNNRNTWWNVITFGIPSRCTQLAFCGYIGWAETQKIYIRTQHDANVSAWRAI